MQQFSRPCNEICCVACALVPIWRYKIFKQKIFYVSIQFLVMKSQDNGLKTQMLKDRAEFYHAFNAEKKITFTTVFLNSFNSFNSVIHVFSYDDYNLSSNKCKLSSIKYKLSYSVFFRKRITGYGSSWNFTEFCGGNIPLLLQHYSKIKNILFCYNVSAIFFMSQPVKFFSKPCGVTCNFFLALSMQHIPEKCCM